RVGDAVLLLRRVDEFVGPLREQLRVLLVAGNARHNEEMRLLRERERRDRAERANERSNPQSSPQSAIRNPQSSPQSAIRNPQSNPQSAIRNPQCLHASPMTRL